MNLSKIIKDSKDFIPDSTFSTQSTKPAVWGDIVEKVDPSRGTDSSSDSQPSVFSENINQTPAENSPHHNDSFNEDFSAPLQEDNVFSENSDPIDQTTVEEKIDLDAFAEDHFHRGIQAGIERMESDFGASIKTLQTLCEQLETLRDTILQNSMEEMINLVLKISETIIRQSLSSQKETIIKTVEASIQQAVKSEEFIISVNPEDFEVIENKSQDFINSISGLENVIIKKNSTIERGGCFVESNNCTVDATVSSQLDIIADAVNGK